jgi:hypothetical protein
LSGAVFACGSTGAAWVLRAFVALQPHSRNRHVARPLAPRKTSTTHQQNTLPADRQAPPPTATRQKDTAARKQAGTPHQRPPANKTHSRQKTGRHPPANGHPPARGF